MKYEQSHNSDLYVPAHIATALDSARAIEKRDFQTVRVKAELGRVSLGCLYYHPEEATDETPIGIVKGLGAPRGVYLGLAEALASRGKPVFVYKSPRSQPLNKLLTPEHLRDPLLYQMQAVHAVIRAIHSNDRVSELRGDQVREIDLGGHSMGNHIMIGTAYHDEIEDPQDDVRIRTLTSIAGAGLDGGEGFDQLLRHAKHLYPGIVINEIWKGVPYILNAAPRDIKMDAVNHIFRSFPRIVRETGKIVWAPSVVEKAEALKTSGIPYGTLLPETDNFFYHKHVLENSGYLFDGNYEVIAGENHVYPNTKPESFAPHLIAMTNVLAQEKSTDQRNAG